MFKKVAGIFVALLTTSVQAELDWTACTIPKFVNGERISLRDFVFDFKKKTIFEDNTLIKEDKVLEEYEYDIKHIDEFADGRGYINLRGEFKTGVNKVVILATILNFGSYSVTKMKIEEYGRLISVDSFMCDPSY
ncbi:hypothetical protein [Bowmanella sp. JS7-9]|uniref:Uncharacterized protein n=1 Tax=Pseudobowmanella zhangzhouensis TaxID=1537679 RepID=A0ABW1XJY7_9ALTE|nr:hypothetical protein [Bowmanella sp. JS7-9]TBX26039.1 hypothetical protein TK45_02220 [Bowmanella sp. JS7-9]